MVITLLCFCFVCLFVYGIFNDAVSNENNILSNEYNEWRIIDWKGYGKKPSWSSLIHRVFILSFPCARQM